jgi:2,3-bisphosphoglycerate-independent phosphoglycerate mutase
MKLILEAVVVELGSAGGIKSRVPDCSDVALRLDGTEIGGVRFGMLDTGDRIEIEMEGENLSEEIVPNYPAPSNSPVMQITFKSPEARFTANTLNKLLRRASKTFKDKALLIRSVKGISQSS